jgi:hypothetical protein
LFVNVASWLESGVIAEAAKVPLCDPEADAEEPIRVGLHEVEAELDAAKTLIELNAAAKKLTRAKAELKALEREPARRPKRTSTRKPA